MSPQEIQRTMDFILRSQADAAIRMERWEEKSERRMEIWEERSARQQQQIDAVIVAVQRAAKAIYDAAKASSDHDKRIRALERSQRRHGRRLDTMRDVMAILTRLEARQAKRLDQLEKNR